MGNSNTTVVIPGYLTFNSQRKFAQEFEDELKGTYFASREGHIFPRKGSLVKVFSRAELCPDDRTLPEKTHKLLKSICDRKLGGWVVCTNLMVDQFLWYHHKDYDQTETFRRTKISGSDNYTPYFVCLCPAKLIETFEVNKKEAMALKDKKYEDLYGDLCGKGTGENPPATNPDFVEGQEGV